MPAPPGFRKPLVLRGGAGGFACRLGRSKPFTASCRGCGDPSKEGSAGSAIWGFPRTFALPTMELGALLQRLFSTFPDGWPGAGLLLLRVGGAIPLVYFGIAGTAGSLDQPLHSAPRIVAAAGGLLLLLGLWTPVVSIAVAIVELWIAFSPPVAQLSDRWPHILLAILVAAVAMLGPGAWSVDARLFGRQRFEIDSRDLRK